MIYARFQNPPHIYSLLSKICLTIEKTYSPASEIPSKTSYLASHPVPAIGDRGRSYQPFKRALGLSSAATKLQATMAIYFPSAFADRH